MSGQADEYAEGVIRRMAGRPPIRTVPIMPAEPPRWVCWLIAFGHAFAPFAPVVVLGHLHALGSKPSGRSLRSA